MKRGLRGEFVDADEIKIPLLRNFPEIERLEVGKAVFYPWSALDHYADGAHSVRNAAWTIRKLLPERRFHTKSTALGVYVIRDQ